MNKLRLEYLSNQRINTAIKMIAGFNIIFGMIVILGWLFYYWIPSYIVNYVLSIKPNTALCFILSGIVLWKKSELQHNFFIQILCGIIFLIGFLTLFEYFFNINLYIDQMIFRDYGSLINIDPGRMSPMIATNFVLIGFILFFIDNTVVSYRVNQLLILILILMTMLELLRHIYMLGLSSIIKTENDTQMSLIVSFAFLLIVFGLLFMRPYKGAVSILVLRYSGASLARRLLPPAIILPIILGFLGLKGQWSQLHSPELPVALIVLGTIIFYTTLILINANSVDKVDIRRQRAESALKKYQSQLKAIINNSSAIISIISKHGEILLVNKSFELLLEKENNEIVFKKIEDIFPLNTAQTLIKNNTLVINSGKSFTVEEVVTINNIDTVYLSNKFPLFNEQGELYAIGSISTDITSIKQMHNELIDSEEKLALALKSAQAGTWTWNFNTKIFDIDNDLKELFQIKKFNKTYEAFENLIYPKDQMNFNNNINETIQHFKDLDTDFRVISQDNTVRHIGVRGKVFRDNEGKPIRMSGACWDITSRKNVEKELRHAKITAEALAQKADEANRAKNAFLTAMSHEVRTPLNGVTGMTSLLLDTPLNIEQKEYIGAVHKSIDALVNIFNDILDFSYIESGNIELNNEDFNLKELVNDIIEVASSQINDKPIEIYTKISDKLPEWYNADYTRIRQVLKNLLNNAIKFTEQGTIRINVKENNFHAGMQEVSLQFDVIDTGVGIPQDVIPLLFKPFSKGDLSYSRKYGGVGLGLVISKKVIELMGGKIGFNSHEDGGSHFWFTIPVKICKEQRHPPSYKVLDEFKDQRVLFIDDNSISRQLSQRQIIEFGLRCDVAMHAGEAIQEIRKAQEQNDPYQVAIVDYVMPGMNGVELIEILHALKLNSSLSIIMLTGLGITFGIGEMEKLNIKACIRKPIRQEKLYECLQGIFLKNKRESKMTEHHKTLLTKQKNIRVLLVEDNIINLQVINKVLEKLGYESTTAKNGKEALAKLESGHFDLILMDCQMPELDGYKATNIIRQKEEKTHTHIPIIAMTAHAMKGDKEKCIKAGMDAYISKPFDITLLDQAIESLLTKNKMESTITVTSQVQKNKINMDRIYEIFSDDNDAIKNFFKTFIDSTTLLVNELNNKITTINTDEAKSILHRIKGSSGNGGFDGLYEISALAENNVINEKWEEVQLNYNDIKSELAIILEFYNKQWCSLNE